MRGGTPPNVVCFATQGTGSGDEDRIKDLLELTRPEVLPFDRSAKLGSAGHLLKQIRRSRPDVVVMEGTGIAGGLALLAARSLFGTQYVVSSGDAVAPYIRLASPRLGPLAALYERMLCARSAGFIGWSPYLVGRAMTFGAPRAMVAANWAPAPSADGQRAHVREELGIAPDALVFGLVGSLGWTDRVGYCYGLELVHAARDIGRQDVVVLVVGDGDGRERLERAAGGKLGTQVITTGRVSRDQVPAYLAAMDIASLPQSVDGVGAFRYTTKISEYLAAGLPIVTGQIPLAYDLDDGWLWRLPGDAPWDARYVNALAKLMATLDRDELDRRRRVVPRNLPLFDRTRQQRQAAEFVLDVVDLQRTSR